MKNYNKKILIFLIIAILVYISGCTENNSSKTDELGTELHILNWEDYFAPNIIEDFEEKYDLTITIETFDEEDYMISKLETNTGYYDLVIASDSTVSELKATKSLSVIEKTNIPNFENIDSSFLNKSFDRDNMYSIPYLWGTTGIAYNASAIPEGVTSWASLWNESYSGKIGMIDNKEEVIGSALKYLGYSINPINMSQLHDAESLLLTQKNIINGYFGSIDIIDKLIDGEIIISQCYSGDALFASEMNENISYVIPEEGSSMWIDNLIIPAGSQNKYTAEVFINYLLTPKISANITNYQWYANPNREATFYIDEEILDDPGIYPSEEILGKCEFFDELSGNMINEYNRIWSELQTI
jgi:spermidine/putrescine transport system substrate-binding protein